MSDYVKPSGEQYVIRHGAWGAAITEVGATLRELRLGNEPILDGFGAEEMANAGRGQVLAPWPNRIRDGRYTFGGQELQLGLSEPGRGNATHGLVRWLPWIPAAHTANSIRLRCLLHPQPGYPFSLRCDLTYSLTEHGLHVSFSAHNAGPGPAPFGLGFHPYLSAGRGPVDSWRLQVPAREMLISDSRMIPIGREAVAGKFDFRRPRPIGDLALDTCFTSLQGDRVLLESERRLELWFGAGFTHLMVFSGDGLPERARASLAVEPMTCAPDAFNSGEGLRVLEAGEGSDLQWGINAG